eukprot:2268845-Amphidinium_carterae.1
MHGEMYDGLTGELLGNKGVSSIGIVRMAFLNHLHGDKQHWPHAPERGVGVTSGRRRGGAVHFAEMDLAQAFAMDVPSLSSHLTMLNDARQWSARVAAPPHVHV